MENSRNLGFFTGRTFWAVSLLAVITFFLGTPVEAQTMTTGDLAGVITDQSGALVPAATVKLRSLDTGAVQSTTTNQNGYYRFSLVMPNRYSVSASKTGFETTERSLVVSVGAVATGNLTLTIGQATQTVQVTEAGPVLNPDAMNTTAFTQAEVTVLPSAGGDITNIALTAPGVVMNNTGGYGNFTVNGMPATSNLFTVNGENDMDPYFNINNTGATNLTLGANDLQEATIISNAYAGQYGTFSGAQVSYVTKSGTNAFHGNAVYTWNGRAMNANDWFNNFYGDPRPFSNANQWAASLGGPIIKNKMFFYVNNEGMRFVLPNVDNVIIPTPAFANAVLANIQAKQPAEFSTYQKLFQLYANAPGAASAVPYSIGSACTGITLTGFNGATTPCAARFQATPTALASEWILSARVDYHISDTDTAYFRWRLDHGVQPTSLSPINANFDAISNQPAYDNQFSETHIFGPRSTNTFLGAFSHYVAQFQQNESLATSTFPYQITTSGSVPFSSFNPLGSFPQGRNVTQYQFVDDITVIRGSHDLKFGANFRRYDVSDHNFFYNSPAVYFGYTTNGLQQFANGEAYQYRKSLNLASDVPVALWGLGVYINDDWHVRSNFKLTLGLRVERNSNPVCQFNCFANFKGTFSSLSSVTSATQGNVPYSNDISYNQHQAFPGVDAINMSPRIGFSWSPGKDNKTVVSGGFGIFYDALPAGLVDNLLANPPVAVAIRVRPSAGVLGFDPAGGAAIWQASANAFSINKTFAQISSALSSLGAVFAVPAVNSIVGTIHAPMWQEWNLMVQRQLGSSVVLSVNYVGNHGARIPYGSQWPNAFDLYGLYPGVKGIPSSAPDSNYGVVTQVQSGAISNYDGLTITARKQFSHGLTAHFNYTWSHNLDESSNGGIFTYGDSILGQLNPTSLRTGNYGNSDYDIRHDISADWVYIPSVHMSNKFVSELLGGWEWGGKAFWRTGLPFSITDSNTALGNYSGSLLATYTSTGNQAQTMGCGSAAATTPCLNASAFVDGNAASFNAYTGLSSQTRNQFRGPGFFDMDMSILRTFRVREGMALKAGIQAFNILNHPNFANPDSGIGDSTFGLISGMAATPTSPYGSFLGFDSSPRVIQLTAKFTF